MQQLYVVLFESQRLQEAGRIHFVARSREVWTIAALNLILAACSFGAAFAPATMHRFVFYGVLYGVLFALTGLTIWVLALRLGQPLLFVGALLGVSILSAVIAVVLTPQGALLSSFGYIWMVIYAGSYCSRLQLYSVLGFVAAGSSTAFAVNETPRWIGIWLLLVTTTSVTGVILERSVGRLRREAETDSLTGLLNRRGFVHAASLERSVSERVGFMLAVVMIDLDNFKAVNDLSGHHAGDRLLREATAAWRAELRAGDLLARYGGDEFILLLPNTSPSEVDQVIARCRTAHPICWTAGTSYLQPGEPIDDCIQRADELLYATKLRQRIIS